MNKTLKLILNVSIVIATLTLNSSCDGKQGNSSPTPPPPPPLSESSKVLKKIQNPANTDPKFIDDYLLKVAPEFQQLENDEQKDLRDFGLESICGYAIVYGNWDLARSLYVDRLKQWTKDEFNEIKNFLEGNSDYLSVSQGYCYSGEVLSKTYVMLYFRNEHEQKIGTNILKIKERGLLSHENDEVFSNLSSILSSFKEAVLMSIDNPELKELFEKLYGLKPL